MSSADKHCKLTKDDVHVSIRKASVASHSSASLLRFALLKLLSLSKYFNECEMLRVT